MKELLKTAAAWTAIICVIPAAAASGRDDGAEPASAEYTDSGSFAIDTDILLVRDDETGEVSQMSIEDYTVYAVLAEIPYIMSPEAMKAQAVAARTYAVRRIISGADASEGAHISNDSGKYQICLTDSEAYAVYGSSYEEAIQAARNAAAETEGEILVYGNSPIIAAFHTASAGYTESAENVWGTSEPYLSPVYSEGDLHSPYYNCRKSFTDAEITARMSAEYPDAGIYEGISAETTASGTVMSAELCGITAGGDDIARIFSLDSAAFTAERDGDVTVFTVNGCGHLAGMSMYGADHMAHNGSDYAEILAHYYSGAVLADVSC